MKRLIINADDFGLTDGVNRAVIAGHEAGVITSTTLLAGAAAATGAAVMAAAQPGLGVGLHLNLTAGQPVAGAARVPSLVDSAGDFPGISGMLWRLSTGLAKSVELEAEIAAQINRCRELGVDPTHIDSHHHLHAHPRLRRLMARVCRAQGIAKSRGYHMALRSPKSFCIWLASALPAGEGLKAPDRFAGIEAMGGADMAAALERELGAVGPDGTLEFMCHPGYADAALARISSYSAPRQVELETLTSGRFREILEQKKGFRTISFRDL